jgi:hypothetical protein
MLEDLYLASGLRDLDLEADLLLVSLSLRSVVGEVNLVVWELELLIIDYHWIRGLELDKGIFKTFTLDTTIHFEL